MIVGSGMFGYKVALMPEFISALFRRLAQSPVPSHLDPLDLAGQVVDNLTGSGPQGDGSPGYAWWTPRR